MKRKLCIIALILIPLLASGAIQGRFMKDPDIQGDVVAFSYLGDIWTVPAEGGTAVRLTNHPGNETSPRISPDGKWIAFSGNYHSGQNVYLIPIDGGVPKRLTYRSNNLVIDWTPDGKHVIFRSGYENLYRPIVKLYSVSIEGGKPQQMPVPRGVLCSYSPDGKKLAYNRRGREEYYWKRYKGGQYQDIWQYDFETKEFSPITKYVGKNSYPVWIGDEIYFVSDRGENGIANFYSYSTVTKEITRVSNYEDFDVQLVSADKDRIIYSWSGYLHIFDPAAGTMSRINVAIPTDNWHLADRVINPKEYIQSMSISNCGTMAAFEARGDVYIVPAADEGETLNLTCTQGSRERYPQISPDGRQVAFFSDKSGEYELYMMNIEKGAAWKQLTSGLKKTVYHLAWSPDGTKILFGNKDLTLFYYDLAKGKLITIADSDQLKNDEFYWEISDYSWSPDSKWVTYSFVNYNKNSVVYLYSTETGKSTAVTDDFYDSLNPSFDANGDYLYYLCYCNYDVRMDVFEDNHVIPNPVKVMAVQLRDGEAPPFSDEGAADADTPFRIDLQGISRRIYPVPAKPGNLFFLKAGSGMITWASTDNFAEAEYEEIFKPGGRAKWTLHMFDMNTKKEKTVNGEISDWKLSPNRKQAVIRKNGSYFHTPVTKLYASAQPGKAIDLSDMIYTVKVKEEWTQIFNDTWRWYRDFFYDTNMHGRDWKAIGDKFKAMIPDLTSRGDLNWLLSQMVGELCVSHTYVWGGDYGPGDRPQYKTYTGLLGAELENTGDGYYTFSTIYGPTRYDRDITSPLCRPDIDVKEGDYLIAINGRTITTDDNPYKYLQITRGQKVTVTVNGKATEKGARTYTVKPVRSEYRLRYNRWIADNIETVLKESDGQLGYMHITAMSSGNVAQFDKYWRAFRYKKGIIIDVRGNGGGWTEYFIIDKLERKMVAKNCLTNMEPFRYPGSVHNGHLAVISNEYNGSDGEAFVEHFKARKLGTVIGTPSWGGLVGIINGQKTLDNGTVHQSNNSFYNKDGKWLVENHGADPDIFVMNDPASRVAGHDKQLETAIELLLKHIQEKPYSFPPKPEYPVK